MNRRTFLSATAVGATGTRTLGVVAPVAAQDRGGTRLIPNEEVGAGKTPADITTVRVQGRPFAVIANHDADEVRAYSFDTKTGSFPHTTGTAQTGDAPAGMATTRRGFVVVANTLSNDLNMLRVDRNGRLRNVGSTPAGRSPSGVAVDERRGFIVAVNRDSDEIISYQIDHNGNLTESDRTDTGNGPEAVAVSRHELVAVANAESNDVSEYRLDSRGRLIRIGTAQAGFFPRGVVFASSGSDGSDDSDSRDPDDVTDRLYVPTATGSRGEENQIHSYRVDRRGIRKDGAVNAGFGLTDIAVGERHVFTASATEQGNDQLLAFDRRDDGLTLSGGVETGTGFSLRNLAVTREGETEYVLVTSFQRQTVRSVRVA